MTTTPDVSEFVYTEQKETFSTWKNNNDATARFRLLTDKKVVGRPNKNHKESGDCKVSVFLNVVIEPGATKLIPTEYDDAIRKVSKKTGQVVGGLCPWLTKVGEEDVVIHTSLDYKSAFQEEEARQLVDTMKKENELRAALELIQKRKLAAEITAEEKKAPGRPKKSAE